MEQARNTTIEWLRILSAFMIVTIHAKYYSLGRIADLAVPMFSAIAGYFWVRGLVGCEVGGLAGCMRRRIWRLGKPLLVWSVLYWVLNNLVFDALIKHQSIPWPSLSSVIRMVLTGGTAAHLWFLPALIYTSALIYLVVRLFKTVGMRTVALVLLAAVAALWVMFVPAATSETIAGWIKLYSARLVIFTSLGGILALYDPDKLKQLPPLTLTFPLDLLLILVGLLLYFLLPGLYAGTVLVLAILYAALTHPRLPLPKWAKSCAAASMDIYLMHVLFVVGLSFVLEKVGRTTWPYGLASVVLAFLLSWGTSLCYNLAVRKVRAPKQS